MILSTDQLVKVYGSRGRQVQALQGVSIALEAGHTLGIVGESGCGKSTLARLLVGLEAPTSGTITLDGRILSADSSLQAGALARTIQLVFQDPYSSLNPRLSVEQAITEVLRVHRLVGRGDYRRRVLELLEMVALPGRLAARYPHELSGGQAQRAAVARALAVQPRILVLDEPTSALDVSVRAEIMNLLVGLQDELGLSYVFVSHDLAMVRHISDEIVVMYFGRIVERGPYQPVLDDPLHPYTRALAKAVPVADPEQARPNDRDLSSPRAPDAGRSASSVVSVAGVAVTGCPYQPRCPQAEDICLRIDPPLRELHADHAAACHVAARLAGLAQEPA